MAGRGAMRAWSCSWGRVGGRRSVAWSVRVCSLVSRGRSICSIVSVSGAVSDVGRAVSGRPGCLPRVRLCSIACVLVRSCAFSPRSSSRCGGSFLVLCVSSVGRCGGWWRLLACPCLVGVDGMCAMSSHLVPSRLSSIRYGERGGGDVWRLVLLAWRRGRRRCVASRACSGCRSGAVG